MSIVATLPVFLLSNPQALHKLLEADAYEHVLDENAARKFWQSWAGMASWQRDSSRPGHVFAQRWEKYQKTHGVRLLAALDCVGKEYLQVVNRRLYVAELGRFARWQNLRSRMSMLPVKCRMLHRNGLPMSNRLAHPLVPDLADYISREGLNETHLHLYACQEPEFSWLTDLENIGSFFRKERKDWTKNRDLYKGVHPELTPRRLAAHMKLARYLRGMLLMVFEGTPPMDAVEKMRKAYQTLIDEKDWYEAPEEAYTWVDAAAVLQQEMWMWESLFSWVDLYRPCYRELEFYAHLYLLIQNEYVDLRRQREERCGFDAFDAVEKHKGVSANESVYLERALSHILQNAEANAGNVIELRVSPWAFLNRGVHIAEIWHECCRKRGKGTPQLVLVVHFIKMAGVAAPGEGEMLLSERYAEHRNTYAEQCHDVAEYAPYLIQKMGVRVGIDAAGDEMLMPPEVFAPVYRQFERACGISHRTYHCGEDFIHLLGGIRAVYDAAWFLNLRQGNRVGHATAIGISPALWKQDMPDMLVLRKDDLLLDLLFAWRLLTPTRLEDAVRVERKLMPLAQKLLGDQVNMHLLQAFYDSRNLEPERVHAHLASDPRPTWSPEPEELEVIDFCKKYGEAPLRLLERWHFDGKSRREQEELEELELDFMNDETLVFLQQRVQRMLNERNVVLETLPVSNLRISQYRDMRQHHLLRWLRVKDCCFEGDEKMTVCMGSDDPGIFVSDLKNEYYHVYANLKMAGLTPVECMAHIRSLNEAGRIYAFRFSRPDEA